MLVLLFVFGLVLIIIILIVGLYTKNSNVICRSKRRLDGKTVLVTGGTSGMGLEIAIDVAQRGARVIVACPFEDEGNEGMKTIIKKSGNQNVMYDHLNLASFTSVRKYADTILTRETRLDILINNAGVNAGERLTEDGWNWIFQINYLGTVLLTLLLLPFLKKAGNKGEPSKIINTTSISHKFLRTVNFQDWDTRDSPLRHYQNSKLCIAIFTRELAKLLKGDNVVVNAVDPGIAGTRIYRTCSNSILGPILIWLATFCSKTAWEGAQTAIHVAVCDEAREHSGKYFYNCRATTTIPSRVFYDDKISEMLWEKTMSLILTQLEPPQDCLGTLNSLLWQKTVS